MIKIIIIIINDNRKIMNEKLEKYFDVVRELKENLEMMVTPKLLK